jgi:hypothetical protein
MSEVLVFSLGRTVARLAGSVVSRIVASKKGYAEDCERECARVFLEVTGPAPEC